ncbi:MAG: hypothetical protein AB7V44_13865 [Pseudonocardia sp.]
MRGQLRRGGLALAAAAAVVLTAGAYAPAGSDTTLTPEVVPIEAPEIPNPLRGQYIWIANPPDPAGWPVPDVYYRDEIQWGGEVERQRGHYDFAKSTAASPRRAGAAGSSGSVSWRRAPDAGGTSRRATWSASPAASPTGTTRRSSPATPTS